MKGSVEKSDQKGIKAELNNKLSGLSESAKLYNIVRPSIKSTSQTLNLLCTIY